MQSNIDGRFQVVVQRENGAWIVYRRALGKGPLRHRQQGVVASLAGSIMPGYRPDQED